MWNVAFFLIFNIILFGIIGIQVFKGRFYYRCRLTPYPVLSNLTHQYSWPIDPEQERLCGGVYTCNPGTYCGSIYDNTTDSMTLADDDILINPQVSYGICNFDNIIKAVQLISIIITFDSWT